MSHINNYCLIDTNNSTNGCFNQNFNRIYNNKETEVYKLNINQGKLKYKKPINPGDSLQNSNPSPVGDIMYTTGHPINNNYVNLQRNKLTNDLNYTSNSAVSDNSTLAYAHTGKNPQEKQ
jgi:hypothetical protein